MKLLTTLRRHADWFLEHAVWDGQSPAPGLWWSMLDIGTGKAARSSRPAGVYQRCYRWIESPDGSNLYWDLPLVAAFHALSERLGEPVYADAAERYVRAYLERATSAGGLWWWGNHYFLGADGAPLSFHGYTPLEPVRDSGDRAPLHETRPLSVPWALLHRIAPEAALAALAAHRQHLVAGGAPGEFNRHADGRRGCDFLEAGGILALAFAHEARLGGSPDAAERAREVLAFSWNQRDRRTSLMPTNAGATRWDGWQATSETGLWAGAAFAVAELLEIPEIADMAAEAVGAWAERAWCAEEERYRGRLLTASGKHNRRPKDTIYCPGTWCDPWEPLFPAHDYPLQAAEASLTAWQVSGEERHALAVERWIVQLRNSLPARNGWGAYAEHYGRAIHFLWRAGRLMSRPEWTALAAATAAEAVAVLGCDGEPALRSHPWELRIDSVDGMGLLMLALHCLEADSEPGLYGSLW